MKDTRKTFQFRVDLVLTVLFLITIFFFGIMTFVTDFDGIHYALVSYKYLGNYVEDPHTAAPWDMLTARIRSLDDHLAQHVYGSDELGQFNSTFQYLLGKRMVTTGSNSMLRLNSGHLYDLQNYVPMDDSAANIVAMQNTVPDGTAFLFVYEHPTLYSDTQMPEGYDRLDHSAQIADEITQKLTEASVPYLDSRPILSGSGLELSEYLYYTDQHWSTRAAILMAQSIAEYLTLQTGTDLHPECLDIDRFDTETYEKLFLGKYGQRAGINNIDPDDITIYYPKYDTNIRRYTNYLGDITDITGTFRESVIRWRYLEPDEHKAYNLKAYFDYGLTENYDIFENPDAAEMTILLLKDSFSAPIGSFLSLCARKVVSMDLRRSDYTLEELVAQYDPDAVVVAYSLQMLRDDNYEFQ